MGKGSTVTFAGGDIVMKKEIWGPGNMVCSCNIALGNVGVPQDPSMLTPQCLQFNQMTFTVPVNSIMQNASSTNAVTSTGSA